ncbi:MAG: hypothetical protein HXX81_07760 [Campylobacterales bacterium]|nr:hypothetical protein [Campylobacterales bacterium]
MDTIKLFESYRSLVGDKFPSSLLLINFNKGTFKVVDIGSLEEVLSNMDDIDTLEEFYYNS